VAAVVVSTPVHDYLIDLAHATRTHPRVALGLSPRGLLIWQRVAQAWAFLNGRPFVTPDDVRAVAGPVLGVRLGAGDDPAAVVREVLAAVVVPVYPTH
jgi:MoxR-like ATPase